MGYHPSNSALLLECKLVQTRANLVDDSRKNEVEEGWDSDGGAPCWARAESTDEELADHQRAAERDERDRDNADERGRRYPRDAREFGSRGARWGNDDAGIRNLFIVENITLIC